MWGNNKIRSSKIETLIGQSLEIRGDVNFSGGLHLDGKIIGNVSSEDDDTSVLILSDTGRVEGDVNVSYAVINGEVVGNVIVSEKLELSGRARITGNVVYNLLEMASGAEVNGEMEHDKQEKKLLEHHKDTDDNVHNLDASAATQS